MPLIKKFVLLLALGLLATAAVACGGDDGAAENDKSANTPAPDGTVDMSSPEAEGAASNLTVNLKNWAVEPSSSAVKAGKVTFRAMHMEDHGGGGHGADAAGNIHQLVVARLEEDGEIGKGEFTAPVLNLNNIKVGEEKTGEADLEPGRYELSCLLVDDIDGEKVNHYDKGMYALLVVE